MGGMGSGRQSIFGSGSDKTTDYRSIDLAWLRREKLLETGKQSTITWSRNGSATGSVGVQVLPGGIRLVYRTKRLEEDWKDVVDFIPFVSTETRFGGERQWFECPSCRRRCRIIYGGSYFRCRRCYQLLYETQYEPAFARAATKALKIRRRLGGDGGIDDAFPDKPKGMHWKTYEHLRERDEALLRQWETGIMGRFYRCR